MQYTQLHKAQVGGAKLKVFLLLVVLATAGCGGWYFFVREPAKKEVVEEEKIPCHSDDEVLCTFIQSWDSPKQYRFTVEETSGGATSTSVYEYDFGEPARIHATLDDGQETITIGNTLYTKSGNVWTKQVIGPEERAANSTNNDREISKDDLAPIEPDHYKKVGTEACGDLTCYKYQVFDPDNADTIQYVWFDDEEFSLRQLRFETGGVISMQTFEYMSVDIDEPSPIQDS